MGDYRNGHERRESRADVWKYETDNGTTYLKGTYDKVQPDNDQVRRNEGLNSVSFYNNDPMNAHDSIHFNKDEDGKITVTEKHDGVTERTSEGCYLTTACLKHFLDSFDDNCHELTVLRWFRDHFVKPDDVALYYKVAPRIVEKIDSLPIKEQDDVYASIYKDVVDACVHFIENGQYNDAYERYMSSTLALQKRFLPATV